ncbi:MAG TPA: homoserine O-succinyltransferase [Gemmatimonadaceae bacterium]|jgi:homoserine O-succinyltransferase
MNSSRRPTNGARTAHDQERHEPLVIALLNNMPDAALETTEQQFSDLLAAASARYDVRLRLFSFPELIRGEGARRYVAEHYEPIESLWSGGFDGLIVTGAEPRTLTLPEEVYWPSLTRLVEWASESGTPTVWSCLAAHAAVLHLHGIQRQRLGAKISGVFRCAKACESSLLAGLPISWRMPHSRLNTLDPDQLLAAGYEILSFSEHAGADAFVLRRGTPFLFYQGHPEYDAGALFREYRRDVGRFLAGTMDRYPELPRGYFDEDTTHELNAFRERAERQRIRELLDEFPGRDALPAHVWHDVAVRLYSNWLEHTVAQREPEVLSLGGAAVPTV